MKTIISKNFFGPLWHKNREVTGGDTAGRWYRTDSGLALSVEFGGGDFFLIFLFEGKTCRKLRETYRNLRETVVTVIA